MKFKSNEVDVWFTSDTHYGHKNIVKGVSDWEDKESCRDFPSIEKMNDTIVNGINEHVKPDDILFHLGDWSFGGIDNVWKFRKRLNVNKVHLILGNHDEHIAKDKSVPNFAKEYNLDNDLLDITLQDMFYSINHYLEITIDKKLIVLCHYPIVSWNRAYRGSWMLHGHTHDTLFKKENKDHWYKKSKILDIGMDSVHLVDKFRPIHFNEIVKIMSKRSFISIDQHDEKTNG